MKDQLRDYQCRGEDLEDLNFYQFMVNTYEDNFSDCNMEVEDPKLPKRGRPRSKRVPYLSEAEKPHKCRIVRAAGHELLPRFIGQWFPRRPEGDSDTELYAASILFLLKPWRNLLDLKFGHNSLAESLAKFLELATEKEKDMIENIQYQHDCWDVAQKRRDALRMDKAFKLFDYEKEKMQTLDEAEISEPEDEDDEQYEANRGLSKIVDEQTIEDARLEQRAVRDRLFAKQAMDLAHAANIFDNYSTLPLSTPPKIPRRATTDDLQIIDSWDAILKAMTRKQEQEEGFTSLATLHKYSTQRNNSEPTIELERQRGEPSSTTQVEDSHAHDALEKSTNYHRPKLKMLNDDQKRAHSIVERRIFGGKSLTISFNSTLIRQVFR